VTCPLLPEGMLHHRYCCRNTALPIEWRDEIEQIGFHNFANATEYKNNTLLVKESFRDCMTTTYSFRKNLSANSWWRSPPRLTIDRMLFLDRCAMACWLHPVKFLVRQFQSLLR
jgi:hypothetical protein